MPTSDFHDNTKDGKYKPSQNRKRRHSELQRSLHEESSSPSNVRVPAAISSSSGSSARVAAERPPPLHSSSSPSIPGTAGNGNNATTKAPERSSSSAAVAAASSAHPREHPVLLQEHKSQLAKIRKELPVYAYKQQILRALREKDVLLVMAETGSGKSTQIPAYIDEGLGNNNHGWGKHIHNRHGGGNGSHPLPPIICVTQPRRVAAITVAQRVAEEMGCVPLGTGAVGYRVRFDDHSHPRKTRILYATDGILLREAMTDPLLRRYCVVILDEAHERSLQTDVLFGVVRRAMRARNSHHRPIPGRDGDIEDGNGDESRDGHLQRLLRGKAKEWGLPTLKVVVMSATLQISTFQSFFPADSAVVIQIPGRMFPVQVVYTKEPQEDYIDAALAATLQLHYGTSSSSSVVPSAEDDENASGGDGPAEDDGDILIFLPGQEEIEDLHQLLKRHLEDDHDCDPHHLLTDIVLSVKGIGTTLTSQKGAATIVRGVMVCVLYAALPPEAQILAFTPKPKGCRRKITLATNIAETSVTLGGVKYVVDCGKHKTRDFSTTTGMESLTVQDISRAQAAQRTGRAGRVRAGVCFRLYTEEAFQSMADVAVPEISRVNLAHVVLLLKGMGVHDPFQFDYLTPPSGASLKRAMELLFALGALTETMDLSEHGKMMAKLPVDPVFAHLLLQSPKYGCTKEILTAVAMLSAENVLFRPGGSGGDDEGNSNNALAQKAAQAHRRFASHEGDLPTLLTIYDAWRKEAVYVPTGGGGGKRHKPSSSSSSGGKIPHGQWCARNFVSGRALTRAYNVRQQLRAICTKPVSQNGLGLNVSTSCGDDGVLFLKCVCAGLFLQSATRLANTTDNNQSNGGSSRQQGGRGNSGRLGPSRGRYKTKVRGDEVSIHPTSTLFGRNPAPKCVVYTELLVTKRTYIRGVTQIREEWLVEVAPHFFK